MSEEKKGPAGGEPLRKISVATVYGKIDLRKLMDLAEKGEALPVMKVWGIASRGKPGESDFGPYVKFNGQFRALNIETGALYRSSSLFLPAFLEEELHGAIGAQAGGPVEFGFAIGAKYDESAATKYVFLADSLLQPSESPALADLENRLGVGPRRQLEDKSGESKDKGKGGAGAGKNKNRRR